MKKKNYGYSFYYGQCYLLGSLLPTSTFVSIEFIQESLLYIHTPGLLTDASNAFIILKLGNSVEYYIELEEVQALDYLGQECYKHNQGNYDLCHIIEKDKFVFNMLNCTTIYGLDMDNICRNETLGKMAQDAEEQFWNKTYNEEVCKRPCSYLRIKSSSPLQKEHNDAGKADFNFLDKVQVLRSQYSFTGFSLVAEVGGYVGLFLGASFLQCSDVLRFLVRRFCM